MILAAPGRLSSEAGREDPRDEAAEVTRRRASIGRLAGLLDWVYAVRDRVLGSARFQRWAADTPLIRRIAHRQASALFDLCAGFVYAQVLAACVRLQLFDLLKDGPATPDSLAARCGLPPEAMQRLLAAAASLGLLAPRSGGRYGLGMLGAALTGNPGIAAMVEHHAMLYDDLRDPVALLRAKPEETRLAQYWAYAANNAPAALQSDAVAGYSALMAASQGLIAEDILAAYNFRRHRQLLDVGGGEGAFLLKAAGHAPELRITLFDLPPVAERAAATIRAHQLDGRATAVGGDFLGDSLPQGADLVTLIRIILDHDDATVLALLRNVRRAIAPGGVLLIAEPISGLTGSRPVSDAYFGLYLFAMGRGRPRSLPEVKALLEAAGFAGVRACSTRRPLLTNIVLAHALGTGS